MGLILVVVLGMTTFLHVRVLVSDLRQSLQVKSQILGDLLAKDVRKALDFGLSIKDLEDASKRCKDLVAEHSDLAYVMIVDDAGVILFHNDPARVGRPPGP